METHQTRRSRAWRRLARIALLSAAFIAGCDRGSERGPEIQYVETDVAWYDLTLDEAGAVATFATPPPDPCPVGARVTYFDARGVAVASADGACPLAIAPPLPAGAYRVQVEVVFRE